MKGKINYLRERKKDLKLEFNNLIRENETIKQRLHELDQENLHIINENSSFKTEISELKEQLSSIKNIQIK